MKNFYQDKVVLITGASSGLGEYLAKCIAPLGSKLVLFSRDKKKLQLVADKIYNENKKVIKPLVVWGDVSKIKDVKNCIDQTIKHFSRIDILLLNAGRSMWKKFLALDSPLDMKEIMDVNYWGVVNFTYYGLSHIKKSDGHLVIISSLQSIVGTPYHTGYASSKHAINGFIDSLRLEEKVKILNVIVSWIRGTSLRKNSIGIDSSKMISHSSAKKKNSFLSLPVDICTKKIIHAISVNKKIIYLPKIGFFFPLVKFFFPHWLGKKIKCSVEKEVK